MFFVNINLGIKSESATLKIFFYCNSREGLSVVRDTHGVLVNGEMWRGVLRACGMCRDPSTIFQFLLDIY